MPTVVRRGVRKTAAALSWILLLLSCNPQGPREGNDRVGRPESSAGKGARDTKALIELGATLYAGGHATGQPVELLRAAEMSRRALDLDPRSPEARYHRALAEDAFMPRPLAEEAWRSYLARDSRSERAWQAHVRASQLRRSLLTERARSWPSARSRFERALALGDRAEIQRWTDRFPSHLRRFCEEELLGRWAEEVEGGRLSSARRTAAAFSLVASAHRRRTGDSYLSAVLDSFERISKSPRGAQTFAASQRAFREGLHARNTLHAREAARAFDRARGLLRSVGSPVAWSAEMSWIVELTRGRIISPEVALARLEPVEEAARLRGYRDLEAKARAHRAYCLQWLGRPFEALDAFGGASELERKGGDEEAALRIAARRIGILRNLGEADAAWREGAGILRRLRRGAEPSASQLLLAEAALTAHSLGAPRVALALQSEATRLARESVIRSSEGERRSREAILGVALNEKAGLESDLGDLRGAMWDLAEAERLLGSELGVPGLRTADPLRAIERFTDALRSPPEGEVGTIRATLSFERAGALERAGRSVAVEGDLRRGFAEIRREQSVLSKEIDRHAGPDLLSAYLARFRSSYELCLSMLLDRGRYREAFDVVERSRVFEPLTFPRGGELSPREIRLLAQTGAPLRLQEVQRYLPRGTVVVELAVLKDRVVAWLVQGDRFEVVIQRVDREVLVELTRRLERQVERRLGREAAETLGALDRVVFERIRSRLRSRHAERIVIVPDGPLHGVPMAALLDARTGRYLVESYVVSSAPSATLFVYCLLRDRKMARVGRPFALLVGDPAFDPTSPQAAGLERLAGAAEEVGILKEIYGRRTVVLKDEDATARAFLADAAKAQMVHYAGHAVIVSPVRSYLALAPAARRSGFLSAGQLLSDLRLARTRLVVLAACSSAGGHPGGPVEIGALIRPIFAAGAPGIVASVWSVGDDRSSRLLAEFHRRYASGADAAEALRHAQLCALKSRNPLARSVLSWASFEVIGYTSSDFGEREGEAGESSCAF